MLLECATNDRDQPASLEELIAEASKLQMLIGFSIMRVNTGVQEIRYQHILSECLAEQTIQFVEASVRVSANGAGGWSGSVGLAIELGRRQVRNSFLDKRGVVACEDLVGGNSSILMQSIYQPPVDNVQKPLAVVFCFHPLSGFFDTWGIDACEEFYDIVTDQAAAIRTYLDSARSREQLDRFGRVLKSAADKEDVDRQLVDVLVPQDTRDTDLPAVVGRVCSDPSDEGSTTYETYCCSFFERDPEVAEALWQSVGTNISDDTASISLRAIDATDNVTVLRQETIVRVMDSLRAGFLSQIAHLRPPYVASDDNNEWKPEVEQAKLCGDLARAFVDQVSAHLMQSAIGANRQLTEGNLDQILKACASVSAGSEAFPSSEAVIEELQELGRLLPPITAAVLCRLASLPAVVDPSLKELWPLRPVVRLNQTRAPHLLRTFSALTVERSCSSAYSIGGSNRLRLFSPRPFEDHDQLLLVADSCYRVIVADRNRELARHQESLNSYAKAQSHTLKNALAAPLILLEWSERDRSSIGSLEARNLEREQSVPASRMMSMAKAMHRVAHEISHTQDQAKLFSWVMDPKNALINLEADNQKKRPVALEAVVITSVIRGALLAVDRKLSEAEIARTGVERPLFDAEVDALKKGMAWSLDGCHRGDKAAARLTALDWLDATLGQTRLRLCREPVGTDSHIRPASAILGAAILTELAQNAFKAAFRVAGQQVGDAVSRVVLVVKETPLGAAVSIENPALESDVLDLELGLTDAGRSDAGVGSRGVKGLWQVQMLSDLGSGRFVQLQAPIARGAVVRAGIVLPVLPI